MRTPSAGLVLLLTACSRPPAPPHPLPVPADAGAPDPSPGTVRDAALEAARAAGLAFGATGPGPWIAEVPEGRRHVRSLWSMSREGPVEPVEGFDLLFGRLPWAELAPDGSLVVRWETREAAPAGVVYLGVRVEEDPWAPPRHRRWITEPLASASTAHAVRYDARRLFAPAYDVNDVAGRGWGEIAWRVEQLDPHHGTTRLYDGRTAFRLDGERVVQQPTVVLGPILDRLADGWVVSFETDVPTAAAVAVDDHAPIVSGAVSTRHEVPIGAVAPGPHAYRVAVAAGEEASVTIARSFRERAPGAPVRLAILCDSRSGVGPGLEAYEGVNALALQQLVTAAGRRDVDAIAFPGDEIDGYVTSADAFDLQLRSWVQVVEGVHGSVPVYEGMGNHEALIDAWSDGLSIDKAGEASAEARFAARFVNPEHGPAPEGPAAPPYAETVYSVDVGDVHLVMLNTNYWYASDPGHERFGGGGNREGFLMDGQLDWLEADLAAARARGAKHLLVLGHEPAFPVGGHREDGMWWEGAIPEVNAMRERFWSLLARHEVVAYVSGDEHNYSRSLIGPETVSGAERPVWSIISGGAGAPYYAQDTPEVYADRVEAFSAQQHFTLWTFDGERVRLEVIGLTGATIEDVDLR